MARRQGCSGSRLTPSGFVSTAVISAFLLTGCAEEAGISDADMPEETVRPFDERPVASVPAIDNVKYPADDSNDDPAGMIVTGLDAQSGSLAVSPWLVTVRLFHRASGSPGGGDMSVQLTRYAEDFPIAAHVRYFSEALDTCVIRNSDHEQEVDESGPPPPGINGGETVVLNTPSGPWLSLERTTMTGGQSIYRAEDSVAGTLPADAMLSIPGNAFPSVAAYPLFEPEPVLRLSPAVAQSITAESRFSWIPLNLPTHVKIDLLAHDESGEFQGYPVSCWVRDDGSFELPADVLAALEPWELAAGSAAQLTVRYSRVYSRFDVLNGIVFHQGMEIAE